VFVLVLVLVLVLVRAHSVASCGWRLIGLDFIGLDLTARIASTTTTTTEDDLHDDDARGGAGAVGETMDREEARGVARGARVRGETVV